jgi:hypothetical protein
VCAIPNNNLPSAPPWLLQALYPRTSPVGQLSVRSIGLHWTVQPSISIHQASVKQGESFSARFVRCSS